MANSAKANILNTDSAMKSKSAVGGGGESKIWKPIIHVQDMSRLVGKPTMWFPNRSDTNQPVHAQKRARSLKFWI